MRESCSSRSLVDRHFAGTIAPVDEHALRTHLSVCAVCRGRYDRYLLLARLDRGVLSAEDRLARGLGLSRRRRAWAGPAFVALSLAAALFMLYVRPPSPSDYIARGGLAVESDQALYVYRITAFAPPRPVDGVIHSSDELAFAYRNRGGWARLLVYAVDQAGVMYWYHPGWTDAAVNPIAVSINAGPDRHELPEAIAQPLPPGRMHIHALFTDEPIDVRAIERGMRPAHVEELVLSLDVIEENQEE